MIKLMDLLLEGIKEKAAEDFLRRTIKGTNWDGKVFIAGGYPRDEFLGLDPKDLDLVVNYPNGGIKFAEWITKKLGIYKRGSNPVLFPNFGTSQFRLTGVKHNGQDLSDLEIEVVMTRKEQYHTGSRKPDVEPGTLKDDVERRDFTVNSLLKDLSTGEILDLTGMGKADLQKGIVRTPLDPDVIFKEDPLRMLRAIRFTVKYNWQLPLFMIKALKRNAHQLKNISAERIRTELDKMLVTGSPDKAVRLLQMTGLNSYVAKELDDLRGLVQNKYHDKDAMGHTLDVLKTVPNDLVTRLAALFHDVGKAATKQVIDNEIHFYTHEEVSADMAEKIMQRLKYPNDIIKKVSTVIRNHMRTKGVGKEGEFVTDKMLRKLKSDLGDHLQSTLELIHADNVSHSPDWSMPAQIPAIRDRLKKLEKEPVKPNLPINGDDIIKKYKLKPGPTVGKLLDIVRDAWLNNPRITKKQAFDLTDKAIKNIK